MDKLNTVLKKTTGPPRHKMAFVTFLVLWPMVHFMPGLSAQLIANPFVAEGVTVLIIVLLMTYLILPVVSRAIHSWLTR